MIFIFANDLFPSKENSLLNFPFVRLKSAPAEAPSMRGLPPQGGWGSISACANLGSRHNVCTRRAGACSRRGSLYEVNETKRLITVLTKCVTETRRKEANLRFARLSTMFQEERSRRKAGGGVSLSAQNNFSKPRYSFRRSLCSRHLPL